MVFFERFVLTISRRKVRWIMIAMYVVFILMYFFYLRDSIGFSKSKQYELEDYKSEYFQIVDDIIEQKDSVQMNIETLKLCFNSVDRKSEGLLIEYGFINVLEDYMVHILSGKDKFPREEYVFISKLIKEELVQEPYSILPADQRRVLKNLENAIDIADSTSAKYNLTEINDILINVNNKISSLEKESGWSIPLGIIGLIVSILFGLIAIVSPISYRKMRDAVKEVLNNKSEKE